MAKAISQDTIEESEGLADRRSSAAAARMCAGIFLLYERATGARLSGPFVRDARSWAAFEQAALPEMSSFAFFDREHNEPRTPSSVLADVMGQIWMAESLPNIPRTPSTIQIITELANRIADKYEITPIDRRRRKRASLGLSVLA